MSDGFFSIYAAICIAAPLILMCFIQQDKHSRFLVLYLIAGLIAGVLSGFGNSILALLTNATSMQTVLYIAPVVEEIMKAIPILILFLAAKPTFQEVIGIGVAVGVGFATLENIIYLHTAASLNLGFILVRGFSTGIMHAMTVALLVAALSFITRSKVTLLLGALGALSVSVSLHGVFNLFVNGKEFWPYLGYALPMCVALFFLGMIFVKKRKAKKTVVPEESPVQQE
ncbi:MAG TPA: PrsW family glutamic-type intramembrane protease [Methanocorpusculum sp.]|nr:PrsW family glutamic-type intramembrane protease [Methanocorpusculum sp.]